MRKLKILAIAVVLFASSVVTPPSVAQDYGRPQDDFSSGQYSGQYSGEYSGQYDGQVDGRASHNEGLPPSAADKDNPTFDNPIDPRDCDGSRFSQPRRAPRLASLCAPCRDPQG
jgi:hypothetical protein